MFFRLTFLLLQCSRFRRAAGEFAMIAPTVGQFLHSAQSPQVATFLLRAHLRISHRLSQNTVLTPSARHPPQFCRFLTQGLVVVGRRNVCVAFFAVQPTAADHAADSGSLHCQSLPSFVRQRAGSQSICASTARQVLFLLCAQPWQPKSSQSPKSSAQAMRVASSLPSSVRGFSAAPKSTGLGLGPRSGFWGAW